MKSTKVTALLMSMFSTASLADPILVKINYPGYQPPETIRSERCEVHSDKVVIVKNYGFSFQTVEERAIAIKGDLNSVLAKSLLEPSEKTPGMICDVPSTRITAVSEGKEFTLFLTAGCGSEGIKREGYFTGMLVDLVDTYCPKTFSYE